MRALSPLAPRQRAATAEPLPRVASINLCADQHLLALADPEQILTVSWLAADPEESLLAREAQRHTLNYGTAEELLKFAPDVVLAGTYTSPFTRTMLRRLGYRVVELEPEASVADIERNVRLVAEVVGQVARGEQLIAALHADVRTIEANRPARRVGAVIVRPGGFTVGADSLADELLRLAGLLQRRRRARARPLGQLVDGGVVAQLARAHRADGIPQLPAVARERRARASGARKARSGARTVTVHTALWACGLPGSIEAAALLQRAVLP